MAVEQPQARFQTTCWTIVESLNSADEGARKRCLDDLARRYMPPVYAYLRSHGQTPDKAEETTQAFFVDVVVERKLFERAVREKGKLRSFVLTALKNYCTDESRREKARGAGLRVALDVERIDSTHNADEPPENAFDREWNASIVKEAMQMTEKHFYD